MARTTISMLHLQRRTGLDVQHLVIGLVLVLHSSRAAAAAPPSFPPDFASNYTEHATRLREDLLSAYDKAVPPRSRRRVDYSAAGTDVALQLRMLKVREVSPSQGHMTIKVWWRMWWSDLRLSWDPAEYGGLTEVRFLAESYAAAEVSEIWLPDVQPYNAIHGMMHTFDPALAIVRHDGSVRWSRPGNLEVMCRFSGLIMFPYGRFSCPVEVGGWSMGGGLVGLRAADASVTSSPGCASFDATEEIALPSYQEISFVKVECVEDQYTYAIAPNDPFPVVLYKIELQRAGSSYTLWTMIPSTLFTLLSFGVFFMSFEVGERLGIGVTLVLTVEVSRGALQAVMPICGEMLWIEIFFFLNMLFTIASLLESCIVLGFAYCQEETLLPAAVRRWRLCRWVAAGERTSNRGEADDEDRESMVGRFLKRTGTINLKKSLTAANLSFGGGGGGEEAAQRSRIEVTSPRSAPTRRTAAAEEEEEEEFASPAHANPTPPPSPPAPAPQRGKASGEMAEKLIFFENLFFSLDVDGGGTISFEEMRKMLAFTALTMTSDEREAALRSADTDQSDGKLTRYEFMDLCVSVLHDQPLDSLEHAAASYAEFRAALKRRSNAYWRRVADRIDRFARFWVPLTYATLCALIVSADITDEYAVDVGRHESNLTEIDANAAILAAPSAVVPMREMLGSASLNVSSNGFGLFVLVLAVVLALGRCYLNGRERWLEMRQMQEMKEASTTLKRYTSRKMNHGAPTTTSKSASAVHPESSPSSAPDSTTKIVDF